MANEKRLIPCGEKVTLDELLPGTIFAYGDDCIAVKREYRCENGLIEAFIVNSGEQFWGGVDTVKEQIALMVQPLEIEEVDAVEVVHGRWIVHSEIGAMNGHCKCPSCNWKTPFVVYATKEFNYCPNCGAKMDGDGNG